MKKTTKKRVKSKPNFHFNDMPKEQRFEAVNEYFNRLKRELAECLEHKDQC